MTYAIFRSVFANVVAAPEILTAADPFWKRCLRIARNTQTSRAVTSRKRFKCR